MLRIVLLVVVVMMLIGSLPLWSHSAGWGYYPVSGLGIVLIVVLLFVFRGNSRI